MSFDQLLTKVFGSSNQRYLKSVQPIVEQINEFEPAIKKLSDEQLRARTAEFKEQLQHAVADITDPDERKRREREALDEILPEAFAIVREASVRSTGMRHFDVQLIGGIVLHQGKIAEMRTGEGKTLVATLPAYRNSLTGRGGVHVITVNDYLASRDAEWMGQIHRFLGLEVGCIQNDMDDFERQTAYAADITYGTNNEFGFDYLRDNMKFDLATCVQRGHYFAIVDEVDSILIDEARTPLIISGPSDDATDKYYKGDAIIPQLKRGEDQDGVKTGEYIVDEKAHTAVLTEEGVDKAERLLGVGNLYDPSNMELLHCVEQALKAHTLYRLDHQYVVQDGEVIIVDDFTGRLMKGRRWSDGLHQAVEAKEGVKIERENQTLATITLQNYFRLYEKLSGMTGTAETEAAEFHSTYKLDVIVIPTHMPMVRSDFSDVIYRTLPEKWDAVIEEIKDCHERGQPALVGTVSVENSELISRRLQREAVPHNVLNAKYHEREAEIVAQAGRKGAVTIATNMAGRGTDILLGGNPDFMAREFLKEDEIDPDEATDEQWSTVFARAKRIVEAEHEEVVRLGGLYIIGTERHESRRIDNQLRGRSGRQGDPGASRFFLSLEDDLMRMFATKTVAGLMDRLSLPDDVPITHRLVTRAIANAQRQVESQNFERRKNVLKYDEVMNKQREVIYDTRRLILEGEDLREQTLNFLADVISGVFAEYAPQGVYPEEWDLDGLFTALATIYPVGIGKEEVDLGAVDHAEFEALMLEDAERAYKQREAELGNELLADVERAVLLHVLDRRWREHLYEMDYLQEGIGLRAIGQRDPLVEYQREAFDMFQALQETIKREAVAYVFNASVQVAEQAEEQRQASPSRDVRLSSASTEDEARAAQGQARRPKVGRNQPCWCGSGKKFKQCHGAPGANG